MELGQKIKELREKKNLTQEDLGLAVGAKQPRGWGSQIENGIIKNLKREHANKLAVLLDVDPIYFYTESITKVEENLINPYHLKTDPILGKKSNKEIIHYLTEENRSLLRENTYLKSLLLKYKTDIYNTDNQNDTV